jgi:hypothetical protein
MSDPGKYEYIPLPTKSSIRLLRMCSGPDEEPVRCSLTTVDLKLNPPPYDCLSYTWSNPLYEELIPRQKRKSMKDEETEFQILTESHDEKYICQTRRKSPDGASSASEGY